MTKAKLNSLQVRRMGYHNTQHVEAGKAYKVIAYRKCDDGITFISLEDIPGRFDADLFDIWEE